MIAVRKGDRDEINLLLEKGCDVNSMDKVMGMELLVGTYLVQHEHGSDTFSIELFL